MSDVRLSPEGTELIGPVPPPPPVGGGTVGGGTVGTGVGSGWATGVGVGVGSGVGVGETKLRWTLNTTDCAIAALEKFLNPSPYRSTRPAPEFLGKARALREESVAAKADMFARLSPRLKTLRSLKVAVELRRNATAP